MIEIHVVDAVTLIRCLQFQNFYTYLFSGYELILCSHLYDLVLSSKRSYTCLDLITIVETVMSQLSVSHL